MSERTPPSPQSFTVVDQYVGNPALIKASKWMRALIDVWRNLHPDQADANSKGFAIWAPVLFRTRDNEDPVEVAGSEALPAHLFDAAFLKKAQAWTYSFRESWMENEINPEDVDVRAINWIWAPCMYADRWNTDPIELATQVTIPDDLFDMIFLGYTRHDGAAEPYGQSN